MQMVKDNLHVGIIMDGNRRWAEERDMNKLKGHKYGAEKLKDVLNWCKEANVRELTIYVLSTENLKRTKKELDSLFSLFRNYFKKLPKTKEIRKNNVRINFVGNFSFLPKDIRDLMEDVMEKTKENDSYTVNLCVGYGGRQEILDAVNKIVKDNGQKKIVEEIRQKKFEKRLYLKENPDLIIRTGGRKRTSNFLLWQSAYSEWFFTDTLWPNLTRKEFFNILKEFENTKRNFGK